MPGIIAVDLDGTLAEYDGWHGEGYIGPPVPRMVRTVRGWLDAGREVVIFTARVSTVGRVSPEVPVELTAERAEAQRRAIEAWCLKHLGVVLPVTCEKSYEFEQIWDDRAVQVIPNTGYTISEAAQWGGGV